jgi:hypothetical protein
VTFDLNSELYAYPSLAEGVDYARRHRRDALDRLEAEQGVLRPGLRCSEP